MEHLNDIIISSIEKKLDDIIIEALQKKGFSFKTKEELENFIISRCRKEDYVNEKKYIFYFDNTPFLEHNYEFIPQVSFDYKNPFKINIGTYKFL